MDAEVAQIASMVLHANAFLQGHKISFGLDHSLAQFCYSIEFVTIPPEGTLEDNSVVAGNPNEWFTFLDNQEFERLNLYYGKMNQAEISDRIGATFVGGGSRWIIRALRNEVCNLWEGIWKGAKMKGDRHWKVYYYLLASDQPLISESISLRKAQSRFRSALDNIISFAQERESTRHWIENFDTAKQALDGESPIPESDYMPKSFLPKEAEQLFVACFNGWVFGGMGSWNEYWFEGDVMDEYNRVSDELYEAICISLIAAVNSV